MPFSHNLPKSVSFFQTWRQRISRFKFPKLPSQENQNDFLALYDELRFSILLRQAWRPNPPLKSPQVFAVKLTGRSNDLGFQITENGCINFGREAKVRDNSSLQRVSEWDLLRIESTSPPVPGGSLLTIDFLFVITIVSPIMFWNRWFRLLNFAFYFAHRCKIEIVLTSVLKLRGFFLQFFSISKY